MEVIAIQKENLRLKLLPSVIYGKRTGAVSFVMTDGKPHRNLKTYSDILVLYNGFIQFKKDVFFW